MFPNPIRETREAKAGFCSFSLPLVFLLLPSKQRGSVDFFPFFICVFVFQNEKKAERIHSCRHSCSLIVFSLEPMGIKSGRFGSSYFKLAVHDEDRRLQLHLWASEPLFAKTEEYVTARDILSQQF